MAKNKKGAKAAVDETSWDEALINEITNDVSLRNWLTQVLGYHSNCFDLIRIHGAHT